MAEIIICYAKCSPCQFGECPDGPHSWMESEDLEFDQTVKTPSTPEEWSALARDRPCGCRRCSGPRPQPVDNVVDKPH